ncbi:anti-sigma factor family protein [Acidobacteriota bacterium]
MKDCTTHTNNLVAFLYGELDAYTREQIEKHLQSCEDCRHELSSLERITKEADSLHPDIDRAMASIEWETVPEQIAEFVFDERHASVRRSRVQNFFSALLQPHLKPVYAALLLGLFLGSIVTFLIVRMPFSDRVRQEGFIVSQEFLDRVEVEMARRETLDYLEKSQFVLLDFVQASPERSSEVWHESLASQRAKDLLIKKKYINPQLEKFRMSKAKEICDQIERLFFELTQLSDQLSEEEMIAIQNLIEDKQLLLKIKLLQRELEESEV